MSRKLRVGFLSVLVLAATSCGGETSAVATSVQEQDSQDVAVPDPKPEPEPVLVEQPDIPKRPEPHPARPRTAEENEAVLDEYEASGWIPVVDASGELAGYMSYEGIFGSTPDPVYIEVYSYDDGALVGYRLRWIGFVPNDLIANGGSLEEIISEIHGDDVLASLKQREDIGEFIASFGSRALIDQLPD